MDQLSELLQQLSRHGSDQGLDDEASEHLISADGVETARACCEALREEDQATCQQAWQEAADNGVSFVAVAKAIGKQLRSKDSAAGLHAGYFYSTLLCMPHGPVSSLFNPVIFSSFMSVLKNCFCSKEPASNPGPAPAKAPRKGRKKAAADSDSDQDDADQPSKSTAGSSSTTDSLCILSNLVSFVQAFGLAEDQEMMQSLMDTCVEIIGANAPAKLTTSKAASSRQAQATGSASELAYRILDGLMIEQHGPPLHTAALLMMRLTPTLLGVTSVTGKKVTAQEAAARKAAALQFVLNMYKQLPQIQPVVLSLIRQLCLKAVDKADLRAAAVSSALDLVCAVPASEHPGLCAWLLRLSHTSRPVNRIIAVDLAHALLTSLPQPFAPRTFKGFSSSSSSSPDMVDAPWSVTLVALLVQRCDDKAAGVRARAVGQLADLMSHFSYLLALGDECDDESSPGVSLTLPGVPSKAVGYLVALSSVPHVELHVASSSNGQRPDTSVADQDGAGQRAGGEKAGKGKKTGKKTARGRGRRGAVEDSSASEEEEEEEEEADEGTVQAQARQAAARKLPTADILTVKVPNVALIESWLDLGVVSCLAHRRLTDDKAPVRKAALLLLEAGLLLRARLPAPYCCPPQPADIAAVEAATADALVTVRKAALSVASRLVTEFPADPGCCELWVRAGLPLIRDAEVSIQDALLDQVQQLVVSQLVSAASTSSSTSTRAIDCLKPLLGCLAGAGRGAAACLGRAFNALMAKKAFQSKKAAAGLEEVIKSLQPHAVAAASDERQVQEAARVARQQLQGAWAVLRQVAASDPAAASWQFLQSSWSNVKAAGQAASGEQGAALLWVISHSAERFPAQDAQQLAKDLLQALLAFNLPPAAVSAHISALHRLNNSSAGSTGGKRGAAAGSPASWSGQLMEGAHQVLTRLMDKRQQDESSAWHTTSAMFVVGELALLGVKPPQGLVIKVQALTNPSANPSALGSQALASQAGASQAFPGSQAVPGGWQDALDSQAGGTLDGLGGAGTQAAGSVVPGGSMCSLAWVCLGKLCLTDEHLAKKAAPLFVQELTRSSSPAVRNNCLVALADMCIHFTALVDGYLPRLAALIRDPHELVRRQALALMANLLMKDYVKWRGALFHRFALALVDASPQVKELAEHLLGDTLAVKAPLLVYNHFLECLFVLNGCQAGLHASRLGGAEGSGGGVSMDGADALAAARDGHFNLKGCSQAMRAKRDTVYHTLLRKMSPENKFSTQGKLVSEVLSAVADGVLTLSEPGVEEVLGDALRLLGSKHIKVSTSRMVSSEEDVLLAAAGGEGQGATQAVTEVARAKGKLVSNMMKKHLVEHVVPLMCELKHMLQDLKHPLLGSLMQCMASMLKDYKTELEDILVADKQLAKEIMYDLKQAELAAKQQEQADANNRGRHPAPATTTTHAAAVPIPAPAAHHTSTPLAAEVLATTRKQGRTASRLGPGASGAVTPGRGLSQQGSLGAGAMTPAAALLSKRAAARTPGVGLKTPGPPGSVGGAGVGAARAGLTPAPLSRAKAAATPATRTRGTGSDDDEDDEDVQQEAGLHRNKPVAMPSLVKPSAPERQWNVQMEVGKGSQAAKDGPKRKAKGSKAKLPRDVDMVDQEQEEQEEEPVQPRGKAGDKKAGGQGRSRRALQHVN